MAKKKQSELIGVGVYTLQEAALYGGLSSRSLSNWLYGRNAIVDAQLRQYHCVSFLDLIQATAINHARSVGLSMQKIRKAIQVIQQKYNLQFPLANQYALVEFDKDVHIQNHDNNKIMQVSGKAIGQELMPEIVCSFLKKLKFNTMGYASEYTAYEHNNTKIILNPKVQFGQPLVENTGYPADVLYQSYLAENSFQGVKDEFGISDNEVEAAILYMQSLKEAA